MRDAILLSVHAFVTIFRIIKLGGVRSVVAKSVLLKHQTPDFETGRVGVHRICSRPIMFKSAAVAFLLLSVVDVGAQVRLPRFESGECPIPTNAWPDTVRVE